MKVRTYLRDVNSEGKKPIYVDYTLNGVRKRKSTGMFLYANPSNIAERNHNKETKLLAQAYVSKLTLKIQSNQLGFKTNKNKTSNFIEYFETITKHRENTDKNCQTWKSALKHLKEFAPLGLHFNDLNSRWLEEFRFFLTNRQKLKNSSCANYFNVVLHAVHDAFRDKLIDIDYAVNVKAPKVDHSERLYLLEEEIRTLENTECKNPLLKIAFLFSCKTGMAWADIKNLKREDIKKDNSGKFYIAFKRQKTKSLQYLPINEDAVRLLDNISNPKEKIFEDLKYNSWMNTVLRGWIMKAGISKDITFHNARHTFATLMLHKGVDIVYLSKLLNHNDLKTTMIYAKVMDEDLRNAVELLNN